MAKIEIGAIKITVEEGKFGRFVKVSRGGRWIAFSCGHWAKIERNLFAATKQDFKLKLTDDKSITRIVYEGRPFISLCKRNIVGDKSYKMYINFSEHDWAMLIGQIRSISQPLKCDVEPDCKVCLDYKLPITLFKGKHMVKTMVSEEKYEQIEQYNLTCENQLGCTCNYCGACNYLDLDECHCHNYDCYDCHPQHFCDICRNIMVVSL